MSNYVKTVPDLQSRLRREKNVIVDFDETLCLINSTHAYIDSARPSFLAFAIVKFISFIFRRLIRNERTTAIYRDWICVIAITILIPWTYPIWRFHHAKRNAQAWMNKDLLHLLEKESANLVGVISNGFTLIISPLLKNGGIHAPLVAGSFSGGWRIRAIGKIQAWQENLGHIDHSKSVFITDSIDDADMLNACDHGTLIEWGHPPIHIFKRTYVPFLYTDKVKRAGRRYLDRGVLRQDIFAVLVSFIFISQFSLSLLLSVVLFQLSFWLTYEFGYYDNDRRAAFERKGTIPPNFALHRLRMRVVPASLFILAFTLPASALLASSLGPASATTADFLLTTTKFTALWLLFLAAAHLVFRVYNRTYEKARILLYPVLQLTRLAGMAIFLPVTPVGIAVIGGFVIGRTAPYVVYRATDVRWGDYNRLLVFLFFAIIMFLLALSRALPFQSVLFLAQFALATIWLLLRSRVEIVKLIAFMRS